MTHAIPTATSRRRLLPGAALAVSIASAALAQNPPCHDLSGHTTIAQAAIAQWGLGGLVLRVDHGGQNVYFQTFGTHQPNTVMALASGTKALTASVLMSLVDQGLCGLDDPVGNWLPEFAQGAHAAITLRQCITHTSGLQGFDPAATDDPTITLRQSAQIVSQLPVWFTPGTVFWYGAAGMHVCAAACEVIGGAPWDTLFQQRIAGPLGMTSTSYGAFGPTLNPRVADGGVSNAIDYSHFVEMLRQGGLWQGTRVLSQHSVDEILGDQTSGKQLIGVMPHPAGKPAGMGVWIESVDSSGRTTLASLPGAFGFWAWVDRAHDTTGVWLATIFYAFAYPTLQEIWALDAAVLPPLGVTCIGGSSPACYTPPWFNATTWARSAERDFGLRVDRLPAQAFGGVSIGFGPAIAPVPFLDLQSYMPPSLGIAVMVADPLGSATMALPLPPGLQGATLTMQGTWYAGGCGATGLLASNALQLDVLPP